MITKIICEIIKNCMLNDFLLWKKYIKSMLRNIFIGIRVFIYFDILPVSKGIACKSILSNIM